MPSKANPRPSLLIAAIRESFGGSKAVYTRGSCIHFFKILKTVYPDARLFWSEKKKHAITRIGRRHWDITGIVRKTPDFVEVPARATIDQISRYEIDAGHATLYKLPKFVFPLDGPIDLTKAKITKR